MTIIVQLIVGEFEFVKGDHLAHPLTALGRRILVDVHSRRTARITFARHQPAGGGERVSVPIVVGQNKVHHDNVRRLRIEAGQSQLECGEGSPARFGHNHFGF